MKPTGKIDKASLIEFTKENGESFLTTFEDIVKYIESKIKAELKKDIKKELTKEKNVISKDKK